MLQRPGRCGAAAVPAGGLFSRGRQLDRAPVPAELIEPVVQEVGERAEVDRFLELNRSSTARDRDEAPVYLARSQWVLDRAIEEYPKLKFVAGKERA